MRNKTKSMMMVFGLGLTVMLAVASRSTAWAYAPLRGSKVFTPQSPFYLKSDANGTFSAQVTYAGRRPLKTMAWGFKTSAAIRAIAVGPMACTAGIPQSGYSDRNHTNIPIDYHWHSSVPNNKFGTQYTMWGVCKFRVNVGGRTGSARLDLSFNYRVNRGSANRRVAGNMDAGIVSLDSNLALHFDDQQRSEGRLVRSAPVLEVPRA